MGFQLKPNLQKPVLNIETETMPLDNYVTTSTNRFRFVKTLDASIQQTTQTNIQPIPDSEFRRL